MSMKGISAMVFWVILQIAFIMPGLSQVTADCSPDTSCECCVDADICPCASESAPAPARQPIAPESGQSLKVPVARISEPSIDIVDLPERKRDNANKPHCATAMATGYAGVSLSVAYCSFVI